MSAPSADALEASPSAQPQPPSEPVIRTVRRPAADRSRKLHVGHFAFMRAVVQGIPLLDAWQRYLPNETRLGAKTSAAAGRFVDRPDERLVQHTVERIREEFAALSRREHEPGTARLLEFDFRRLLDPGPALPSLEDFAVERQLEDLSQAEQTAAYEERYRADLARARRRGRLMQRQLEALKWLEGLVAQPPRAGDAVVSWLATSLGGHLQVADIFTIAQLIDRINGIGRRWYSGINGIGAVKARRIEAWLNEHEATIGRGLGAHIERPRSALFQHELERIVQPAADIRPLEKFSPPAELDGRLGLYRRPQAQCLIQASNDYQAVLAWLRMKAGLTEEQKRRLKERRRQRDTGVEQPLGWLQLLSHTQRSYRKEAERFMLWVIVQKGKALSSVSAEDCAEYRDFLADPQPRSRWCGERARERWSPLWRPFEGPLKPSAQRQAVSILANLYAFLSEQNYLMGNPWRAVTPPRVAEPSIDVGRSLTQGQWQFAEELAAEDVADALDGASETSKAAGESGTARVWEPQALLALRLQFTLELLYATGLRREEAVAARVDELRYVSFPVGDGEPVQGWTLRVLGKGQKLREVPVPDPVVERLKAYLAARGLHSEPDDLGNRGAYLLGRHEDLVGRVGGQVTSGGVGLGIAVRPARPADPREGIGAEALYAHLKRFFERCARKLRRADDVPGAERFTKVSTHWLRHTHASHAIATGMPLEIAQQNLGHASLNTTTVYVTTEAKRRMQAVSDFWGKRRAAR
jgi:site-specific recombinase XerD